MIATTRQSLTSGQRLTRILLTLAVILPAWATAALAQPATCDPGYWKSMQARAWTEAEREIEQNQNLIYKADSILEYTCFDKYLQALSANAPNLFSETTAWGAITSPVTPDLGKALNILVAQSLPFWQANFDHKYLGDRSTLDYKLSNDAKAGSATYDCKQIFAVWRAAKCQDFDNKDTTFGKINTQTYDDLFDMAHYTGGFDARHYASACPPSTDWGAKYPDSINSSNVYPKETYQVYANYFTSTTCTSGGIATGVKVQRNGVPAYPEVICVTPGCAQDQNATNPTCTNNPP
jgi:hypothetical protein